MRGRAKRYFLLPNSGKSAFPEFTYIDQTQGITGEGLLMLWNRKVMEEPVDCATREDFCRLFEAEMKPLYLLAFLLTANHAEAEQCFVSGIDDAAKGNRVFK